MFSYVSFQILSILVCELPKSGSVMVTWPEPAILSAKCSSFAIFPLFCGRYIIVTKQPKPQISHVSDADLI